MSAPDEKQLAEFARDVLAVLEARMEWTANTADEIGSMAQARGLAKLNGRQEFTAVKEEAPVVQMTHPGAQERLLASIPPNWLQAGSAKIREAAAVFREQEQDLLKDKRLPCEVAAMRTRAEGFELWAGTLEKVGPVPDLKELEAAQGHGVMWTNSTGQQFRAVTATSGGSNVVRIYEPLASREVAEAILQARDLCGNERQAARDYCAENGLIFSSKMYAESLGLADQMWRSSQQSAGATILTPSKRATACRGLKM